MPIATIDKGESDTELEGLQSPSNLFDKVDAMSKSSRISTIPISNA